jgi:hypothetical protein
MKLKIVELFKKIYLSKWFSFLIILIGAAIRLRQYFFNRSLWLDEAMLALNIIKYNYTDLLKPLDYNQTAPPLFLIIVKFLTKIFGYQEQILRLFPLLAGIVSLFLFWYIADKFLNKFIVPLALVLLSFSRYAIYFSNEFKQYSVDLMVTIIILIMGFYLYKKNLDLKNIILICISGTVLIFTSDISIFILATISVSLFVLFLLEKKPKDIRKFLKIIFISLFWFFSFLINYLFIIKERVNNYLLGYWQGSFAPIHISSINDLLWYPKTILDLINNPLYLYFPGIVLFLIFVGLVYLYKNNEKFYFLILILPIFFTFIASILKFYPIYNRLMVFTLPILYLIISKGFEYFSCKFRKDIIIIIFLTLLILFQPLIYSSRSLIIPRYSQETRPAINYYLNHKSKNDKIYVYYNTEPAFLYYTRNIKINYIKGKGTWDDPEAYFNEIKTFNIKGRIWFIFSHVRGNEKDIFVKKLNEIGKKLDELETPGASLYLYNIN